MPEAELFLEYMDMKRLDSDTATKTCFRVLKDRYAPDFFNLIIAVDDGAFRFILERRKDLFPGTPVVFGGVNNYSPEDIKGYDNVTGIVHAAGFNRLLELAFQLLGEIKNVYVVFDNTETGRGFFHQAQQDFVLIRKVHPELKIFYLSGKEFSHRELFRELEHLPPQSIVIQTVWIRDRNNEYLPVAESCQRISVSSTAPVFCIIRNNVGYGPLGGEVISGQALGNAVGEMAHKILTGTPVKMLPIEYRNFSQPVFDYRQLLRWGCIANVPAAGRVINAPGRDFLRYNYYMMAAAVMIVVAIVIIFLLIVNIFRRRRAEQAFLNEKALREITFKELRIGFWEYDVHDDQLKVNSSYMALGERPGEKNNMEDVLSLVHHDDKKKLSDAWSSFREKQGRNFSAEFRVINEGHSVVWLGVEGYAINIEEDGCPKKVIGILHDITARKEAESALLNSEKEKELILNSVTEGLMFVDKARRIKWMNSALLSSITFDKAELLDYSCKKLGLCHEYECAGCPISRCIEKNEPQKKELMYDGTVRVVKAVPVADQQQNILGAVVTVHDVTEQRRTEQTIVAAKEEAEKARSRAESANRAKSDFLAKISHEIRTPMNGIIGTADLLIHSNLTPEQQQYARTIESSGETLLALINSILDLSKIEAGKMKIESEPFSLPFLVHDLVSLMNGIIKEKNLTLKLEYDEGSIPEKLLGDRIRLQQILMNLMSNAIKFTDHGEVCLRITASRVDDFDYRISFSVKDTGIGISGDTLAVIFEKFTQADNSSTRRYGGCGLGLAISSELVRLMGGILKVESKEGVGSEFFFSLPFRVGSETGVSSRKTGRIEVPDTMGFSILLAEDSKINQLVMNDFLVKQFGCRVTIAENGRQVIDRLEAGESFDMIFMDCHMPEIDGYKVSSMIRNSGKKYAGIKIVAMTADAMSGTRERCIAAGMDDYASKPVRLDELRQIIKKHLMGGRIT